MISGGCVGGRGAGNVIYCKGHAVPSFGKVAFSDGALSIAPGGAGGSTAGTVAPYASYSGVGYQIVIGVMHGDGNSGCPSVAL